MWKTFVGTFIINKTILVSKYKSRNLKKLVNTFNVLKKTNTESTMDSEQSTCVQFFQFESVYKYQLLH